jgi:uncharacterized protein YciI
VTALPAPAGPGGSPPSGDLLPDAARAQFWVALWTPLRPWAEIEPLLADHLRYLVDLEKRGAVFASGPFGASEGSQPGAGMTILRAGSREEAVELAGADPLVLAGLRSYSLRPWSVVEGSLTVTVRYSDSRFTLG